MYPQKTNARRGYRQRRARRAQLRKELATMDEENSTEGTKVNMLQKFYSDHPVWLWAIVTAVVFALLLLTGIYGYSAGNKAQTGPVTTPAPITAKTTAIPTKPTAKATATVVPTTIPCEELTDSDVLSLFGFDPGEIVNTSVEWDIQKWNRQASLESKATSVTFVLPSGWGLTYRDSNGDVWVTIGRGQQITAVGFTLRAPCNQLVAKGIEALLEFENEWASAPERGDAKFVVRLAE